MDPIAEIKKLYYEATKATVQDDLARAIEDHVKDERDELFPKARSAPGLDLAALGIQLKERQLQVMREAAPSVVRSRRG